MTATPENTRLNAHPWVRGRTGVDRAMARNAVRTIGREHHSRRLERRIPGTLTEPIEYFHQVANHLRQAGVGVELAHFDIDGGDCVDAQVWLGNGFTLRWSPDHPWRTGWYLVRPHSRDQVGVRIAKTVKPAPLRVVDAVRALSTPTEET